MPAPAARFLCALLLGLACALPAAGQGAPPPVEAFFSNPLLDDAELSPSGRYLAAISGAPGRRDVLVVVDLQENKATTVAGYKEVDVLQFQWVNDERLMFNVSDKQVGPGGRYQGSGLYAVDRDGGGMRQLAARSGPGTGGGSHASRGLLPARTAMLAQRGAQDSNAAYVNVYEWNDNDGSLATVNLLRLDTVTGLTQVVQRPGPVDSWMLDNAGQPRLAVRSERGTTILHYLDPASGKWRKLASFSTYKEGRDTFAPVGFGADGSLYVRAYLGQDTAALHTLDLATGKINSKPVLVTPGYDFDGGLVTRRGKLLGAIVETDAAAIVWFDPEMQALQHKVDALLPGTVNLLSTAARADAPWVLVRSFSDVRPLAYHLYSPGTGKLNPVGSSREGIDPARMGRQDPVRIKARDGREIPALLTLPAGGAGKKLPLVVLVHGGPYVRGNHWGWEAQTQFLASRGYAVIAPDFRGSTGYGTAHYQAGWKQWGLKMQDDMADAAHWAVAQGHADPQRICIAGASYGGYAALIGLVKDPALYKCAVNWVGVTDINLLYDGHWSFDSDLGEDWKVHGMPVLVGDQVKDAAQLKATSPIEQAARITQPLLLAYGAVDRRVPLYHGNKFREAVASHNQQVEWVVYQDEGHGWTRPETRFDFWKRVEAFLGRHIGAGAAK
ncbi:alpha/beta hydrolase family protein [Massilia yuzhufengensis]|uniref:Dipeptidyl aminopeptidase/acylaminoacyl peptidase n=1 Tax=Massilia yuzhufengensis TaxID=1164594 RepID=A0A1I1RGK1_9BURK|nr:alpha/beta fold hydrolase [Massilia yuzhufengensis]SFD33332.1 Dipeptidyl aminopeptidase/acylaminoacyl peptidase [Massilia yuzhufengensis]